MSQHGEIDPAELRRLPLDGPVNFRDLGGYRGHDGMVVRRRHLFRSDALHRLSADDVERVHDLGITTLIDFRTTHEVEAAGLGGIAAVDAEHRHLPTFDTTRPMTDDEEIVESLIDAATAYEMMLDRGRSSYAAALHTVADSTDPVVFFCAAGKDRTGVFAAIVLGLLGVDDTDIVHDYALTGEVIDRIHALRAESGPAPTANLHRIGDDLRNAYPASMTATIDRVHDRWGGWEEYADDIGVDGSVVERLRSRLLV